MGTRCEKQEVQLLKLIRSSAKILTKALRGASDQLGPEWAIKLTSIPRHKKLETTALYSQVATATLRDVVSPLDVLPPAKID